MEWSSRCVEDTIFAAPESMKMPPKESCSFLKKEPKKLLSI